MSIEKTIQSLLEDAAKLKEANEVVPTKGTPEPSNAKNNVDDEPEAKGGTSKKTNRVTQGALPAEALKKLQAEACDKLDEDEMIEEEIEEAATSSPRGTGMRLSAGQRAIANMKKSAKEREEEQRRAAEQQGAKMKEDFNMDEAVSALFNGEEGLTEEFRQKAETIFEAAVTSRVKEELARIEESFEQRIEEALEEQVEGLVEHVDGYLNLMVEQWVENNAVALESGMKADILESFVHGMKNLFQEHYVDVPEERFDVLGALESKIEDLNAKLDESVALNVQLNSKLVESTRDDIVAEACAGLSDLEAEKLQTLAEEISFEDSESFARKMQTIRENYFVKTAAKSVAPSAFLTEETIQEEKAVPADMRAYVDTISTLIR
jgi:hypothetical protein